MTAVGLILLLHVANVLTAAVLTLSALVGIAAFVGLLTGIPVARDLMKRTLNWVERRL